MDEVCRVCGLPIYLSVDRCPYCGEKYGNCHEIVNYGEKYRSSREIADRNLTICCTANELRKLYGLIDV